MAILEHSCRKDFFRGRASGAFPGDQKHFSREGGNSDEISVYQLETKRKTFFSMLMGKFQIPGSPCPPFRRPHMEPCTEIVALTRCFEPRPLRS